MAAACGSLKHIFENPLPEKNPSSLIASLSSWKQKITPPADHHSFTELFGEFHYKDNTQLFSSSPSSPPPPINGVALEIQKPQSRYNPGPNPPTTNPTSDNITHMNSNSLELCTEGLGSESQDDAEYSNKGRKDILTTSNENSNNNNNNISSIQEKEAVVSSGDESCSTTTAHHHMSLGIPHHHHHQYRRSSRSSSGGRTTFPPPISCIGMSGKPRVYFKSYRQDGRFVLQEVRIPTQEFLHASREDGRLRLRFVQPESDLTDNEDEKEDCGDGNWEDVICDSIE